MKNTWDSSECELVAYVSFPASWRSSAQSHILLFVSLFNVVVSKIENSFVRCFGKLPFSALNVLSVSC